jgi:DNA-binding GntR family transcriptional regulator
MIGTAVDHGEIMNAVIDKDSKRAIILIRDHIETMAEVVLRQYGNQGKFIVADAHISA